MKKLIKALSLSIILGAASSTMAMEPDEESANVAFTNTSNTCSYEGHVIRVSAYNHNKYDYSYVYWREKARDNFYYYAKTNDERLLNAAMHAMVGPKRVKIRTDSCEQGRNKGYIDVIWLNP